MAALTVGGVTINLAREDVQTDYEEYRGDRSRMLDATMRETEPVRKRVWHCVTRLLTSAEEATQRAALVASPPLSCDGDILVNVATNCHIQLHASDRVRVIGALRYRLRFTIFER